ncbi:MAG: WYL domain-containing protein, partial [Syntrophales bacterium]|nr:WYL domain-containing protein [Syntrophales bacterium]
MALARLPIKAAATAHWRSQDYREVIWAMPAKIVYERFLWFHEQVTKGRHPNARTLARRFEVSGKTAQRDIAFMRDRLHAPLSYDPAKKGFYYNATYELPSLWLTEDEVLALLLAARLASAVPDQSMKMALRRLLDQIIALCGSPSNISIGELRRKVSVKNIEYSHTDEGVFHTVLEALVRERPLRILYHSPHDHRETRRDILPCHLLQYMGTWHLIAHCYLRQ